MIPSNKDMASVWSLGILLVTPICEGILFINSLLKKVQETGCTKLTHLLSYD